MPGRDSADLVVVGRRVALPDGVAEAAVVVRAGRIVAVVPPADAPAATRRVDAGDLVVLPGLVDTHVHVNEPGRTEWEGFATATRAALAGGVTTLVDMPLNAIPATTDVAALAAKRAAAQGRCHSDVGFWGGVVPGNRPDLEPLARAGVLGFKAFLVPSGVDEFHEVSLDQLWDAAEAIAPLKLPLLVHAEHAPTIDQAAARDLGHPPDARRYRSWLESRPGEATALSFMAALCGETKLRRLHVVHVASGGAPAYADLPKRRSRLTLETCPHYLTFAAEEIPDGATPFKCAPPIGDAACRETLWRELGDGTIDLIATDHSPCPPDMKGLDSGDFFAAWGGIASLELGLAAVWTGASPRGYGIEHLVRWMSSAPAALAGLRRKGAIAEGRDADLVLWDPDATWTVRGAELRHRHPLTPYEGMTLRGRVRRTFLRGVEVFDGDGFPAGPIGREVDRAATAV